MFYMLIGLLWFGSCSATWFFGYLSGHSEGYLEGTLDHDETEDFT